MFSGLLVTSKHKKQYNTNKISIAPLYKIGKSANVILKKLKTCLNIYVCNP